jgi:UDP-N-acetylglucosamine 4-epimerase
MIDTTIHSFFKNKSVLITGGAGFIGSNLAETLLKNEAKVVVLDNLSTGRRENILEFESNPNFTFIEGDITDLETCRHACQNIDYVSHQAALGSVPRSIAFPEKTNLVNVQGFVNMLLAAKDADVKQFVYASSSSVYGDEPTLPKIESRIGTPLSPYAVSKLTNELYADVFYKTYGLKTVGLRYFNVFGPKQDPNGAYAAVIPLFIDRIKKHETVIINGDGNTTRDFTFVANAVEANLRALMCSNSEAFASVFNVACGQNFSLNQLFDLLKNKMQIEALAEHHEERKGDIRNSLADISKAKNLLGYEPKVHFEEGIEKTIAWFLK